MEKSAQRSSAISIAVTFLVCSIAIAVAILSSKNWSAVFLLLFVAPVFGLAYLFSAALIIAQKKQLRPTIETIIWFCAGVALVSAFFMVGDDGGTGESIYFVRSWYEPDDSSYDTIRNIGHMTRFIFLISLTIISMNMFVSIFVKNKPNHQPQGPTSLTSPSE